MTLKQLCAFRQLTLEELAERASVPVTTIVKIDAGALRAQRGMTSTNLSVSMHMTNGMRVESCRTPGIGTLPACSG